MISRYFWCPSLTASHFVHDPSDFFSLPTHTALWDLSQIHALHSNFCILLPCVKGQWRTYDLAKLVSFYTCLSTVVLILFQQRVVSYLHLFFPSELTLTKHLMNSQRLLTCTLSNTIVLIFLFPLYQFLEDEKYCYCMLKSIHLIYVLISTYSKNNCWNKYFYPFWFWTISSANELFISHSQSMPTPRNSLHVARQPAFIFSLWELSITPIDCAAIPYIYTVQKESRHPQRKTRQI